MCALDDKIIASAHAWKCTLNRLICTRTGDSTEKEKVNRSDNPKEKREGERRIGGKELEEPESDVE
eukprot:617896-Amorphochlora_amoeboformis.AAC.1